MGVSARVEDFKSHRCRTLASGFVPVTLTGSGALPHLPVLLLGQCYRFVSWHSFPCYGIDAAEAVTTGARAISWSVGCMTLLSLAVVIDRDAGVQFEDMTEMETDLHAAHAAEYFWWAARPDIGSHKVTERDMAAVMGDARDGKRAFDLFDIDGDGYVVEEEVHARFQQIYRCASAFLPSLPLLLAHLSALLCAAFPLACAAGCNSCYNDAT